jgi:membrane fusion protein (multidrug efflux system)
MADPNVPPAGEPAKPDDQASSGPDPQGQPAQDGKGGPDDQRKKANLLKNPTVLLIGGIVLIILIVGGLFWWLHARQYVNTDDAFVDVHTVRLAPQAPGQVSQVLVDDNALVEPGQMLVEIDASTARAALDQAEGQKTEALAKIDQARAQVAVNQATERQSLDQVAGLRAQAESAERDAARLNGLLAANPRAVAKQDVDDVTAKARAAAAQRDAASHQAQGAAAQVRAAQAAITSAQATLQSINATIAQNQITLGYTRIAAPIEGYVAQKSVAPGAYVQPGQQLMAIVPRQMWVTANFKETQLKRMRVGQPVDMKIDACPTHLTGKVASIQRGAGQAFALLPSENATGNFVKVVQRVPVKISFDDVPKECPLGPGLSVQPRVKVR